MWIFQKTSRKLVKLRSDVSSINLHPPTSSRPCKLHPQLERLEDRLMPEFAPDTFLTTPFPSHDIPLAEHFHPHLHIFVDGVEHVIPGDTNIVKPSDPIVTRGVTPGLYPIHVHIEDLQLNPPDTGKLHVESTLPYDFHLGDFFTIWSYTSGSEKVLNSREIKMIDSNGENIDFKADVTHTITMTVDGQANNNFENLVLRDPHSPLPEDPGPNIIVTGTTLRQPQPSPTPPQPPPSPTQGTANQVLVSQYYMDCLGRAPDPDGLAHFSRLLDQGTATRAQVALTIQTSLEARTRQVETLFQKFLGRQADPVGLDLSTRFLGMGGSLIKLESVICDSPEYFSRNGGTNSAFLTSIYHDVLGRPVDPVGQTLGGQALSAGMNRGRVAQAVFTSPEGIETFIVGNYSHLLHRGPDSLGLTAAGTALRQRLGQLGMLADQAGQSAAALLSGRVGASEDEVISVIMGSDEYFGRLSAS